MPMLKLRCGPLVGVTGIAGIVLLSSRAPRGSSRRQTSPCLGKWSAREWHGRRSFGRRDPQNLAERESRGALERNAPGEL
jgi:hypothetical protein